MKEKLFRFSAVIVFIVCLFTLISCDPKIVMIEIEKYPDKIVYITGIDMELDLSGAIVAVTTANGVTNEYDIYDGIVDISSDVIIGVPGVYKVKLSRGGFYRTFFPIQVVEQDFVENARNK